ncbi:Major facilitator superfamily domain, general substrate transporter [Ophiocordyceps camponoti-floridani]|uniref:Major facilitator superfamily domain, general substrate transporter n=1 Tax=Ophiocordyceps camponoti-floridani TaxID=2030778 RepID=A0A8H4VAB9_9HYPO|nr:Major facilitator superfamily domain, general substrate transporter [Ophiocordyceps camponoti-floridani]KAF4591763.1 Major facilitator superfamily domain, general substrate transporter [Ophiocordyceps camponoti-floridani]
MTNSSAALPALAADLGTSSTISNLSVAMYMLAMSIFPLWWSSFSELLGRRTVYLISTALFIVSALICALSSSAAMLIVFRVLTGGASASVQTVGAGTISDIWPSHQRGTAFGAFYLGPLVGPMISPIVGGLLSQRFGWRSTMYFLAGYGALLWLMLLLLLPETLPRPPLDSSSALRHEARSRRSARLAKNVLVDPLGVILILRFPPVLLTVLVAALAFGALFIVNVTIQQAFSAHPYAFSQRTVGLLYLPTGLGYFVAALLGGRWIDHIMARRARKARRYDEKGRLVFLPEDRMGENMWLANVIYPLGLLLFGWSISFGLHWLVPSAGGFLFGLASMMVFATSTTMLTEFVRKRSSTGVAVNNFVRNILSCVGTIVAAPWLDAAGPGYVFTAVSLFCLVAGLGGIWVLGRNAGQWRRQMDEALNDGP